MHGQKINFIVNIIMFNFKSGTKKWSMVEPCLEFEFIMLIILDPQKPSLLLPILLHFLIDFPHFILFFSFRSSKTVKLYFLAFYS